MHLLAGALQTLTVFLVKIKVFVQICLFAFFRFVGLYRVDCDITIDCGVERLALWLYVRVSVEAAHQPFNLFSVCYMRVIRIVAIIAALSLAVTVHAQYDQSPPPQALSEEPPSYGAAPQPLSAAPSYSTPAPQPLLRPPPPPLAPTSIQGFAAIPFAAPHFHRPVLFTPVPVAKYHPIPIPATVPIPMGFPVPSAPQVLLVRKPVPVF